ncbi:MAG: translation initiation factor IF-3 [Oscillospiraceae bacterium]|jgi:translation initiation factor IF-3|nr:translation initiation factor IF-3 [Oscillospiraceae bacterium]
MAQPKVFDTWMNLGNVGGVNISINDLQINEAIRDKQLRVIGSDGSQLGLMSLDRALVLAFEKDLDLVKIAPAASPPVCKIMDYGKYRFEQSKKGKEAKKKQCIVETKEIRLSWKIDTHDFDTKVNHAKKFLKNGSKIKVSIRFKGRREMNHPEMGYAVMEKFAQACSEVASVERSAKLDGRTMLMFLASKESKPPKHTLDQSSNDDALRKAKL